MILSLIRPTEGEIELFGYPLSSGAQESACTHERTGRKSRFLSLPERFEKTSKFSVLYPEASIACAFRK